MKIKNEDDRRFSKLTEATRKQKIVCPHCGAKVTVPFFLDKKLCTICGYYVYRNKHLEFKEKLKSKGVNVNVKKDQEKKYREA